MIIVIWKIIILRPIIYSLNKAKGMIIDMNIQNLNINYIVNYLAIRNFNLIYENDEKKFSVFYSDYYKAFILARK